MRSAEYTGKADVWPLNADAELLAIVIIESREAIENIDEILSVPGLGATRTDHRRARGSGSNRAGRTRVRRTEHALRNVWK